MGKNESGGLLNRLKNIVDYVNSKSFSSFHQNSALSKEPVDLIDLSGYFRCDKSKETARHSSAKFRLKQTRTTNR